MIVFSAVAIVGRHHAPTALTWTWSRVAVESQTRSGADLLKYLWPSPARKKTPSHERADRVHYSFVGAQCAVIFTPSGHPTDGRGLGNFLHSPDQLVLVPWMARCNGPCRRWSVDFSHPRKRPGSLYFCPFLSQWAIVLSKVYMLCDTLRLPLHNHKPRCWALFCPAAAPPSPTTPGRR